MLVEQQYDLSSGGVMTSFNGEPQVMRVTQSDAKCRAERDMRALGDSQTRLFRVIEEVSQELTQRLGAHEAAIGELRRAGAEGAARRDASAAEVRALAVALAGLRQRQSEQT